MKKSIVLMWIFIIGILGVIIAFINTIFGNPISYVMAKHSINKYVNENYNGSDLVIEKIVYNFKDRNYFGFVSSRKSIDTHFTVYANMFGKIISDTYRCVLDGTNTYYRINDDYRNLVKDVFNNEDFPMKSDINYGYLRTEKKRDDNSNIELKNGINLKDLKLDGEYNIYDLGKDYGKIVFYSYSTDISYKKVSEQLLLLKKYFDNNNIPFNSIDFVLMEPKQGNVNSDNRIHLIDFLYKDIYPEGLEERVKYSHIKVLEYFKKLDDGKILEKN